MDRSNRQVAASDGTREREERHTGRTLHISATPDNTASPNAGRGYQDPERRLTRFPRFNLSFSWKVLLGLLFILSKPELRVEALKRFEAVADAQSGDYSGMVALIVVAVILVIAFLCTGFLERPGRYSAEREQEYSSEAWIPIYRGVRRTRRLDVRHHVNDVRSISDICTSFGTGYIYVSGSRGGSEGCVFIMQLDRFVHITNIFNTDVPCGYLSFISISPFGELIVTSNSSTDISVLNDRGRLLKSVETGSRCGRCVSDGQSLYVCHPDRHCVTVLDYQGQHLLEIGDDEFQLPWFLAMDRTRMLYISDERSKCLHVFSSDGDLVRQIGGTAGRESVFWPQGVCVDPVGNILLSDRCGKCVYIYSREGSRFHTLRNPQISKPLGVTVTITGDAVILVNQTNPASLIIFSA